MSNNIGYARVSTTDQSTDLQVNALTLAGTARIFIDHASGATTDRPALISCLEYLNPGDTLLVWRIDRLGRSITDLIKMVSDLSERGIQFRSLTEVIDTSTPAASWCFTCSPRWHRWNAVCCRNEPELDSQLPEPGAMLVGGQQ